MATTLAVLGSVIGDEVAAGRQSGQMAATLAVRELLQEADRDRWLALADLLELLAEAAPDAFLNAVEESLKAPTPPVMALFEETDDGFGGPRSSHSSLLWALETLAFSTAHVSRACVVLARLAFLDPGGRWSNRPAESLNAILHLIAPQGVVNAGNRLAVLDAVIHAVPEHAAPLMTSLVMGDGLGIIRSGPQYRDWPTPRAHSTRAEYATAVSEICTRLLTVPATGVPLVAGLVGRFSSADQGRVLIMLNARWSELDGDGQNQVLETLSEVADRHRLYRDAQWAMPDEDLAAIDAFLSAHGLDLAGREDVELFGWSADVDERRQAGDEERKPLGERRRDVVAALLPDGLEAVVRFAQTVELPGLVGWLLADITSSHDDAVLDLLEPDMAADDPVFVFAANLARRRAADLAWLTGQVTARAGQAGRLLLCAEVSAEVLDLVDAADQDQQIVYWSSISPYRVPGEVLERVGDGLIAADRPFSALVALSANDEQAPPTDLIIRVLSAPTGGTEEDPRGDMLPLDYHVGRLLDRLEATGFPDAQIAGLEFFYLPALTHTRDPRALHRELARDPAVFADVASRVFRPDEEPDLEPAEAVASDAPHDDDGNHSDETGPEPPLRDEEYRYSEACWRLLHDWHDPLPGSDLENPSERRGPSGVGRPGARRARGTAPDPGGVDGHRGGTRRQDDRPRRHLAVPGGPRRAGTRAGRKPRGRTGRLADEPVRRDRTRRLLRRRPGT
jgi:hypothetical protein